MISMQRVDRESKNRYFLWWQSQATHHIKQSKVDYLILMNLKQLVQIMRRTNECLMEIQAEEGFFILSTDSDCFK